MLPGIEDLAVLFRDEIYIYENEPAGGVFSFQVAMHLAGGYKAAGGAFDGEGGEVYFYAEGACFLEDEHVVVVAVSVFYLICDPLHGGELNPDGVEFVFVECYFRWFVHVDKGRRIFLVFEEGEGRDLVGLA